MRVLLLTTMLLAVMCSLSEARTMHVRFGRLKDVQERLAQTEFRHYFARMFSDTLDESECKSYDLIIGTPESCPEISRLGETIPLPDGKNADQGYTIRSMDGTIYVIGRTGRGVLYGVYKLLEQYGVYFQISGERMPERKQFEHKQFDIRESPVFKYRGLLPWDNFACGMSGYSLSDYKELIDRATRMKLNMLQFHFYPGYSFFTEVWNGKHADPSHVGDPVDVFNAKGAIGESAFAGQPVFGPKPYVDNIGNPRAQAEGVQAMMRSVIDYAHSRGMKTCVGFELMYPIGGDFSMTDKPQDNNGGANFINPLDTHNVDLSLQRYRTLVSTYPNSDFYWMWQSEARGYLSRNVGREAGAAEMRAKYAHWAGNPDLTGDVDYAYLFREVANRLTPEERSKLATGGWSIQHIFPGMNADFPKEITFASLNSYYLPDAQKTQVPSYRVAQNNRPAWMIEWWEFDGEEWFPQFRAGWQESMYQRCMEFGVESVTLLGWKLSGIEHNVRYLSEFSWNPKLKASDFYTEWSQNTYGPGGGKLADVYIAYDKIEPETPGYAPGLPPMFISPGWEPMKTIHWPVSTAALNDSEWRTRVEQTPANVQSLKKMIAMDSKSIAAIDRALPNFDEQGREWATLLSNRLQCRVIYAQSMVRLDDAVLAFDKTAKQDGIKQARAAAGKHVTAALDLSRKMIETYAEIVRNTGDKGLIAQLNEQYYRVIKSSLVGLGIGATSFAKVDDAHLKFKPILKIDLATWTPRDGAVSLTPFEDDGQSAIRIGVGDEKTQFNSVFVRMDSIDLEKTPILDFKVRVAGDQPVALMFLPEFSQVWYALNLVGTQSGYLNADALPVGSLEDGKWHHVTWNLGKLAAERIGSSAARIHSLIFGNWEKPPKTGSVEFKDFTFGTEQ